jgi:hypothetical protein
MVVEILEAITPALSALAGGLFAVLGGVLAQRKINFDKNREFMRNMIQEVYALTIETEEWLQQETVKINQYVASGYKFEFEKLKSKSNHIKMLLKLYFKNSCVLCNELDQFEKLFYEGMKLAYSAPTEFNIPENQKTLLDSSTLFFVSLVKIREFLENEIYKITRTC